MTTTTYLIEPVDTWFFRDALPFDAVGGTDLRSLFPPPARTVAGALWQARNGGLPPAQTRQTRERRFLPRHREDPKTGSPDTEDDPFMAALCRGPYLAYRAAARPGKPEQAYQKLYPMPLDLLWHKDGSRFARLDLPLRPVHCDLGRVFLPKLAREDREAKALEQAWITGEQLAAYLAGTGLPTGEPLQAGALFTPEPRIGLARHNARRTAADGLLYNSTHVRLHADPDPRHAGAGLFIEVAWPDPERDPPWRGGLVRLGGEGRLAEVREYAAPTQLGPVAIAAGEAVSPALEADGPGGQILGLILLLLTPGQFGPTPVPPGLKPAARDGRDVAAGTLRYWKQGKPGRMEVIVHAGVVGKVQREGGWNPAKHRPRRVRGLLPAGSLWYCTLPGPQDIDSLNAAIAALHGARLGEDIHLGRGELAVGLWRRSRPSVSHPTAQEN